MESKTRNFVVERFSFPLLNIASDFANGDPDRLIRFMKMQIGIVREDH